MQIYTVNQWVLFFFTYCFFGWIFESTFVSICKRRLTNRGFMRGPFLPLYGSGAILALIVTIPFRDNYVLMYIIGAFAATVLEYFTGVVMEALFKVKYWDYSRQKFNYKGRICLTSTIAWGFLVIALVEFLQPQMEKLVFLLHGYTEEILVIVITVYFVADFTIAFKEAYELRDLLIYIDKAKDEIDRLKNRLDVVVAVADDELTQKVESWKEKTGEYTELLKEKTAAYQLLVAEKKKIYYETIEEQKEIYRTKISGHNIKVAKRFMAAHPTAQSDKFKEAFSLIKEKLSGK